MTPGSTTAIWLAGSIVLMAVISSVERTTQPSTALAPPDSPVPAPRVTSGVPVAAQADTTSATSAVVRGRTTATGFPNGAHSASSCTKLPMMSGSVTTIPAGRLAANRFSTPGITPCLRPAGRRAGRGWRR